MKTFDVIAHNEILESRKKIIDFVKSTRGAVCYVGSNVVLKMDMIRCITRGFYDGQCLFMNYNAEKKKELIIDNIGCTWHNHFIGSIGHEPL